MVVPPKQPDAPGRIGDGRFGVYDSNGDLRGQVTRGATSVTVARLTGRHGAEFKDGAWRMPKKGAVTAQAQGALDKEVHAASLRASRGNAKRGQAG